MKTPVTQKHIEEGEQASGLCCPIANALRHVTGLHWVVRERAGRALAEHFMGKGPRTIVPLPEECLVFMRSFDAGNPALPFEFDFNFQPEFPEVAK